MRALLAVLAVTLMTGCVAVHATTLVPGPGAALAPGEERLAFVEVAGVRLWAGGDWNGEPENLGDVVTPIRLTLENHSGRAVRVSYQDFAMLGGSGFRYAALPPFSILGSVSELPPPVTAGELAAATAEPPTVQADLALADTHGAAPVARPRPGPGPGHPQFHSQHFRIAPPYIRFYAGFPLWTLPWLWTGLYYDRWHGHWPTSLPSEDMVRRAFPEGVLEDDGVLSGYVYFQYTGRETALELQVSLVDATSGEALGVAKVPFQRR